MITISITLITVGLCLGLIYITILRNNKVDLTALSINQQNIIRSIYQETKDEQKTLTILQEYFDNYPTFGKTGEYLIGIIRNDSIIYLVEVRNPPFPGFNSIPLTSPAITPMRMALSGRTGIVFGHDYRGVDVLAYCTYLPELGWGLVTKMDLKEVMIPFFLQGLLILFVTFVLILIARNLFIKEFKPVLLSVQRSEERFRNLFEYSVDPIWEFNASALKHYFDKLTAEGIKDINAYLDMHEEETERLISLVEIISVNRRSEVISNGFPPAAGTKSLLQFFNRSSVSVVRKVLTDLYSGLNRIETEIEFTINEKVKSYLAHVSLMPGHEHDLADILVLFVDITRIKEYQEKLVKSEAVLKKSQEIAHLGSWELDLLNNKLFWTDEVYRIFGMTPGQGLETYDGFLEAIHPDDRTAVDNAYSESLRNNLPGYQVEHRIIKHNTGEIRYVHEKCDHFRDETGQVIRSSGMILDITDRKKNETELLESKQKLSLALEAGKIGVWEWDPETDHLILDSKAEEMFGLEPGEYKPSFSSLENMVHEDDLSHLRAALRNSLRKNSPVETIFRVNSNGGDNKYISIRAMAFFDKHGKPVMMSGVAFDLTEFQQRTELMVSKLNEVLLRSNKELEDFAYVASHDLQEPLRMVTSFTQLLSKQYGDKLDNRAREYIDFAVDGAKRMYDLLNDLLSYSRINTRGEPFSKSDLTEVLENTMQNLSLKIKERKAVVKSDRLPIVNADRNQMIQLFQNLISNSIKFSRDTPEIYISSKSEKGQNIISVRDNGIGIDPVYFDRIFKIFKRLHQRDEFEGTGVGLAICKRIVERHGGKIWVESGPGKGSTFFFSLPRVGTRSQRISQML